MTLITAYTARLEAQAPSLFSEFQPNLCLLKRHCLQSKNISIAPGLVYNQAETCTFQRRINKVWASSHGKGNSMVCVKMCNYEWAAHAYLRRKKLFNVCAIIWNMCIHPDQLLKEMKMERRGGSFHGCCTMVAFCTQKTKTIITTVVCSQHLPSYHKPKNAALRYSKVTIDQQSIKCFWVTAAAGIHTASWSKHAR